MSHAKVLAIRNKILRKELPAILAHLPFTNRQALLYRALQDCERVIYALEYDLIGGAPKKERRAENGKKTRNSVHSYRLSRNLFGVFKKLSNSLFRQRMLCELLHNF